MFFFCLLFSVSGVFPIEGFGVEFSECIGRFSRLWHGTNSEFHKIFEFGVFIFEFDVFMEIYIFGVS
jgi:hypothetical protein